MSAGPYLVTCVRVLKSRDLMERSTSMHPMYYGEGGTRSEQPPPATATSTGQVRKRRGEEELSVSEKGPLQASSRGHPAPFCPPPQTIPLHAQNPR